MYLHASPQLFLFPSLKPDSRLQSLRGRCPEGLIWGSEDSNVDPLAASVSHGLYVVLALLEVHQLCLSHQEDLHLWNVGASPPNLHSACTMKLVVNSGFFIAT